MTILYQQNSLDNILKKFAHLATELLKLRNVVMTTQFTMDTEPTVQAYSNALLCYLKVNYCLYTCVYSFMDRVLIVSYIILNR